VGPGEVRSHARARRPGRWRRRHGSGPPFGLQRLNGRGNQISENLGIARCSAIGLPSKGGS
jgi:hypothetical protein